MQNDIYVRNFSIISHVDHGKSTLADRLLELTGTIEKRKMREQVLDSMELERERGITIKMQPVRMRYEEYVLNLIDTPGHVDFSYEVSRALSAVEGALLLVDATEGVQAQTLSVLRLAQAQGLAIVPAISKIDSPLAKIDDVRRQVAKLLAIMEEEILLCSGKTGEGVESVLKAIVERIPAPKPASAKPANSGYGDCLAVARQTPSICCFASAGSHIRLSVFRPSGRNSVLACLWRQHQKRRHTGVCDERSRIFRT
ncbi:MAG: GTP-binding protein lepA [Candidatus Adlerbacteria bacterium GW2011_GWA1_54_10]|uniref:GTP-binding protein lepA n=1 Tax=Candidatus Adlerbacteria bacterium GW2011_GWA1_54_10 TaxID=1618605 RepID=A0A0G1XXC7_9BACT|nr:MAG: GTP-binding protein lepA [Candidatus Adlerbacteria bacterium GW2011_GWA1_54_10]